MDFLSLSIDALFCGRFDCIRNTLHYINSSGQIRLKKVIYIFYNINNNEIPGFLSHGIMIELSSHVKNNMISSQVKRLPQ